MLNWIRLAFSDNGQPSSSRLMMALSTMCVLFGWLYVAISTHRVPDGAASSGAAALAVAPYAMNRASNMTWGKKQDNVPQFMESDKKDS